MPIQLSKTPAVGIIVFIFILIMCGYWLATPPTSGSTHDKVSPEMNREHMHGTGELEGTYETTTPKTMALTTVKTKATTVETTTTVEVTTTVEATTTETISGEEEKTEEVVVEIKDKVTKNTPNIIFALADDLGWGDVEYNNGNPITPNLNKMAKAANSMLLQRYYSGSPVCSPTRGTVLTGRNHNRYCIWDANKGRNQPDFGVPEGMPLPLSEISVAKILRRAGYATALFGKWHLGDFKPLKNGNKKWPVSHPGQHGFEQWIATTRSARTCTLNCGCFKNAKCILGHTQYHPGCTNYYTTSNQSDQIISWPNPIEGEDSHFLWSLAEKFIREQVNLKKPFFLYLPFHAVHIPYIATDEYRNMYLKHFNSDQADYYGAISAMDEIIGRMRDLLEELGIKKNTFLWFSSDNGPERGTPGVTNGLRDRKRSVYEGGIRVPAIIEWSDVIKSNKVSWFPIVSSDFLPTVYDILGVKPEDDRPLDGISILPYLRGEVEHRNHSIFWAFVIPGNFNGKYAAVVSGDQYKLVAHYDNGEVTDYQLYDLVKDIKESNDLKDQYPDLSRQLLRELEEWRLSVINSAKKVGCIGYSRDL